MFCDLTGEDYDHHVPAAGHGDTETHQRIREHLPSPELAESRQSLVHLHSAAPDLLRLYNSPSQKRFHAKSSLNAK